MGKSEASLNDTKKLVETKTLKFGTKFWDLFPIYSQAVEQLSEK